MDKPLIDLPRIRAALFGTPDQRRILAAKYNVSAMETPQGLEAEILRSFGQAERPVEATTHDNQAIFRAAVRSLGSNSRDWKAFLNGEAKLVELTGNYDPVVTAVIGSHAAKAIQQLIPGQTSGGDARAIVAWAERLNTSQGYDSYLKSLREETRTRAQARGISLTEQEMTAMIALIVGMAPDAFPHGAFPLKASGMGPTLASEFLRNLGWSGFKPDRHVRRLLTKWFPEDVQVRQRAEALAKSIGTRRRDAVDFLYFSILGAERSPPGMQISHVDNLVWLYGAMIDTGRKARSKP